jgi:signal transduction histidine kinase
VVAHAVRDARLVAPDWWITFKIGDDAAYLVNGDEQRLRQVLANLLANAVQHTLRGTPIDVRIRRTAPGQVEVDVEDAGPGLTLDRQLTLPRR